MFTVWRVEHPTSHCGPYNDTGLHMTDEQYELKDELNNAHGWDDLPFYHHPSWTREGYSKPSNNWVSCFPDFDSLYTWFTGFVSRLLATGFEIVTYQVARPSTQYELLESGRQSAFLRNDVNKATRKVEYADVLQSV